MLADAALRLARFLARERLVRVYVDECSHSAPRGDRVLRGVNVVARFDGHDVLADVDVSIQDGLIAAIEPSPVRADGERWLVGGLVDAHVHTQLSDRQTLTNLISGVTGVREMCGFPWMTTRRDRIGSGVELGPRMMVAGHIISTHPMDGYTTLVSDPAETRAVLADQRNAGYDAVKVHNRLSVDVYDAAAESARASGLPLVGHIPHGISVGHAIASGQRTVEHLKGYYQDWDLELNDEPWQKVTAGADVWNCPTLVLVDEASRAGSAHAVIEQGAGLVDAAILDRWRRRADSDEDRVPSRIFEQSVRIIADLAPVTDKWLAGTDSGGDAAFLIPGIALHREMALMQSAGFDRDTVLHAATHAISDAHPESGFPAAVKVGEPADLLLLESDPRTDADAYNDPIAVIAGGRVLDRETRRAMRAELDRIDRLALSEDEVVDVLTEPWGPDENDWHRTTTRNLLEAAGIDSNRLAPIPQPRQPIPDHQPV